jgi:TPP-dependent pyruvate/acetoin dehydrogenase alpha subunit
MAKTKTPAQESRKASPFISAVRLRELYGLMLRLTAAEQDVRKLFARKHWPSEKLPWLSHPAMIAGCLAQLREGDVVGPSRLGFAANFAAGAELQGCVRQLSSEVRQKSAKTPQVEAAEALAILVGASQVLQLANQGNLVLALVEEKALLQASLLAVLRRASALRLPLILLTISRELPSPGESQTSLGLPQIAVAGEDVVAIYRVAYESIHRARTGIGPTWIRVSFTNASQTRQSSQASLEAMQKFLLSRNLYDVAQPKKEQSSWSSEWKAAVKGLMKDTADDTEGAAGLPIRSFDAF